MTIRFFAWLLLALLEFSVAGLPVQGNVPLERTFHQSEEPLTTEKIWKLSPAQANPHRTRWLLARQLELRGFAVEPASSGHGFAPKESAVISEATAYLRTKADPLFSTLEDFPCTTQPQEWFATYDGAQFIVRRASEVWQKIVAQERVRFELNLKRLRSDSEEKLKVRAREFLADELIELDRKWNLRALAELRGEEWKYYQREFRRLHLSCSKKQPPRWESLMKEDESEPATRQLIARSPAKRWGGLYSIRVSVRTGRKELLGKFLIDSAAPLSLISPVFLNAQGGSLENAFIPGARPEKVSWSGGAGMARPAYLKEVKIGGTELPMHVFYAHETDFFGPPESFAACCDGVLGADFLRHFVVEFRPGKTAEVNLYAREGFHAPPGTPWVELSTDPISGVVSDCDAEEISSDRTRAQMVLHGVKWQTGNEEALEAGRDLARRIDPKLRWNLRCGELTVAKGVEVVSKESASQTLNARAFRVDVGMEVLGRDDFVFDLSHGKLWLTDRGIRKPIVQNHSGLNLEFSYQEGERALKVMGIKKSSPAERLEAKGLRPGIEILTLDSKSIEEMDTWEVEQRLSGVYGKSVELEWKTGTKTTRLEKLDLSDQSSEEN